MTDSGGVDDSHATNSNSGVRFANMAAAPLRLPPLSPLPAFEATVRLGSMTLAAEELGRTHSAISRQIRALEDAIGLQLLDRSVAPLALTTAGRTLYATTRMTFEALDSCMGQLRPAQGSETVTCHRLELRDALAGSASASLLRASPGDFAAPDDGRRLDSRGG